MNKENIFLKISKIIVEKRNLIFFAFILMLTFCFFSLNWTVVENELTAYLDKESKTVIGLDIFDEEFQSFGSATIMLSNVTVNSAFDVVDEIENVNGVNTVTFEHNADHYLNSNALISVSFDYDTDHEISVDAINIIKDIVSIYDVSIDSEVGYNAAETLQKDIAAIAVYLLFIMVTVLVFTSNSYAEIPLLFLVFGAGAVLHMGTNFIFEDVSFISSSVGVVLQLALAIDYAIILCHRFAEERKTLEPKEACIVALSKAIPEISSSSLTTIFGLLALSFMNYGIGGDLSKVLIKSILLSLVSVFTLMPGLLLLFSPLIDKTKHRNFVPSIKKIATFSIKGRNVIVPIFIIVAISSMYFSQQTEYIFSHSGARAKTLSEKQIQLDRINENFGSTNGVGVMVPIGNYALESEFIEHMLTFDEVDDVLALASTEALDGYGLTDYLTSREFSELLDLDYELCQLLFATYAINDEDYGRIVNPNAEYKLALIDLILFVDDLVQNNYVDLDDELQEDITSQAQTIRDAQAQLQGDNYSLMLFLLNLPEEGDDTYSFLNTMEETALLYFDETYLVGNSTSNSDLSSTFAKDNIIISVLSALFVVIILLFTFGSVGTPILLIIIIQSAIFMNFSAPYLQGEKLYFIGYLVVSSLQMGANVDYAIVITSRYLTLKNIMDKKDALIQAIDDAFATILTSGSILAFAGFIMYNVITDGTLSSLGLCIGRGTSISIFLVLLVFPSLLYMGTGLIEKTQFSVKFGEKQTKKVGTMQVSGNIKGYVNGYVNAKIDGTIKGEVSAKVSNIEVKGGLENDET